MLSRVIQTLACMTLALAIASSAQAGAFLLKDPRGPNEISEETRFYLDGKLAATFKLGDDVNVVEKLITTPDGRLSHHYALCGEMTFLNRSGMPETRVVETEGILRRPDGHVLMATADNNLTDFYIVDATEPDATDHHKSKAHICSSPIS